MNLDLSRIRTDSEALEEREDATNINTENVLGHSESSIFSNLKKWKEKLQENNVTEELVEEFLTLAKNTLDTYPEYWKDDFIEVTGEILNKLRQKNGISESFADDYSSSRSTSLTFTHSKRKKNYFYFYFSCFFINIYSLLKQIITRIFFCRRKRKRKKQQMITLERKEQISYRWLILFFTFYFPWFSFIYVYTTERFDSFGSIFETFEIEQSISIQNPETEDQQQNNTNETLHEFLSTYCSDLFKKKCKGEEKEKKKEDVGYISCKELFSKYFGIKRIPWVSSIGLLCFNFWGLVLVWNADRDRSDCQDETKLLIGIVAIFFALPLLCIILRGIFIPSEKYRQQNLDYS
eukprot:snap_masked-scaffold_26-processed-gene-4.52-mRNA-1 protein AED:1.00 eAED:1.00 QI:0/0/0/0/1/1/3/0/349